MNFESLQQCQPLLTHVLLPAVMTPIASYLNENQEQIISGARSIVQSSVNYIETIKANPYEALENFVAATLIYCFSFPPELKKAPGMIAGPFLLRHLPKIAPKIGIKPKFEN